MGGKDSWYGALLLVCLCGGTRTWAASASGEFDARTVILEGTIKNVDWSASAVTIQINISDGYGKFIDWTVRANGAPALQALSWKPDTLKASDKVDLVVHPARDDTPVASLLGVIFGDGHMLAATPKWKPSLIPAGATTARPPSPDPVAGYYGNTVVCKGPTFDCHTWFGADHRFVLFSRDQQPDGSNPMRGLEGTWWLQKLQDGYYKCFVFDRRPIAPICHGRVNFEKVGATWDAYLPSGVQETRWMLEGHQ
jgi:hypothetical protein